MNSETSAERPQKTVHHIGEHSGGVVKIWRACPEPDRRATSRSGLPQARVLAPQPPGQARPRLPLRSGSGVSAQQRTGLNLSRHAGLPTPAQPPMNSTLLHPQSQSASAGRTVSLGCRQDCTGAPVAERLRHAGFALG